jgi:hypothetical protein
MWRIGWAPISIPIYIQQDATLHSLVISGNCSTCFGWYFHPSSGVHTTVSTASNICHTVTAICRYRGRVGTGLSVLWVAYATHSTLKPVPTLPTFSKAVFNSLLWDQLPWRCYQMQCIKKGNLFSAALASDRSWMSSSSAINRARISLR